MKVAKKVPPVILTPEYNEKYQVKFKTGSYPKQYFLWFYVIYVNKVSLFLPVCQSSFFFKKREEIFVQLDQLEELDRITHAWIGFQ